MRKIIAILLCAIILVRCGQSDKCQTVMTDDFMTEELSRSDVIDTSTVFNVPVVFHVLYENESENIDKSLILGALETLKRDFLAINEDINLVPKRFQNDVGSPKIKFYLADDLPNGAIIRKPTKVKRYNFKKRTAFRQSKIHDPSKYLNVYICDLNTNAVTPTGRSLRNNSFDNGIAIDYKKVFPGSRTITHEVGHFFSLYHIFEGKCRNKDRVADTPAQKKHFNCPSQKYECGNYTMLMNFMGYNSCRYFFTKGQVIRMRKYISKYKSYTNPLNKSEL